MILNCIVVDDEPLALDLVESFISKIPFLHLKKRCKSAFEAMHILQVENIDLIFLDIQMPDITGIQLLKNLPNAPMVIFITAYDTYALEGFNLDVIDFLIKPIPFERFLKAVNKAFKLYSLQYKASKSDLSTSNDFMFVKSDCKAVKIRLEDITYIEGLKDYIKIYTHEKHPILTIQSLKFFEEKYAAYGFIRVHRSYIVSLNKIDSIHRNRISIGDKELPIGELYSNNFFSIVKEKNLFS